MLHAHLSKDGQSLIRKQLRKFLACELQPLLCKCIVILSLPNTSPLQAVLDTTVSQADLAISTGFVVKEAFKIKVRWMSFLLWSAMVLLDHFTAICIMAIHSTLSPSTISHSCLFHWASCWNSAYWYLILKPFPHLTWTQEKLFSWFMWSAKAPSIQNYVIMHDSKSFLFTAGRQ